MFWKLVLRSMLLAAVVDGSRWPCRQASKKMEKCLKSGYEFGNCAVGSGEITAKLTKSCRKLEERIVRKCSDYECEPRRVNGGWSEWSDWTKCSAECGGGNQTRKRTCNNPAPVHGGENCTGVAEETKICWKKLCPIDGGWSDDGDWSECSAECGGGIQTRRRTCNSPTPAHGGADCEGEAEETQTCNKDPCPIDCEWSDFGDWSECSAILRGGHQTRRRNRTCSNPVPADGGADCVGDNADTQDCNTDPCPAYGGKDCVGDAEETRACNLTDSCPDGTPAQWIPVTNHFKIFYDLENFPLEIKTNSTLGSDEFLAMGFFKYTPLTRYPRYEMFDAGGFEIIFSSTPQYYIQLCTNDWLDFLTTLPSAAEKIWKITLDKSSGIRVKVHCNGVLVVDHPVSRQSCSYFNWRTSWMNDVTDIWISTDTRGTYFKHCRGQSNSYMLYDLGGPRKNTTVYGDWGDWSACSVNCGEGTQNRTRTCINTASISVLCDGETTETQQCNLNDCPEFSLVDSKGNVVGAGTIGLLLNNGGTVCDDDFSAYSAAAVCRKMGYLGQMSYSSGSKWTNIQSGLNITLDDVACSSRDWESCSFVFSHNCNHNEDIFLQCSGPG